MLPSELWDEYVSYDPHGTTFLHVSGSVCRILAPMCKAINEVFMKKWAQDRPILTWNLDQKYDYYKYASWNDNITRYAPAGMQMELLATNSDFYYDKHWSSERIREALGELDHIIRITGSYDAT